MCRWLAYSGPPIFLDRLLFEPRNSLISQSLRCLQGRAVTNGDGFGIGWYGEREEPGVYRDVRPAWNDENLRSLAHQIRAGHFLAHVRATTGSAISAENCHPFRHGRWLYMHNGQITEFARLRRDLAFMIDPAYFPCLRGTTDSELFFYLLLTLGAADDPAGAYARAVGRVLEVMAGHGVEGFHMTAALSDGRTIHALRYASDGQAPSLYYSCGVDLDSAQGRRDEAGGDALLILSEPLDESRTTWREIPQSHLLTAGDGGIAVTAFAPSGTASAQARAASA